MRGSSSTLKTKAEGVLRLGPNVRQVQTVKLESHQEPSKPNPICKHWLCKRLQEILVIWLWVVERATHFFSEDRGGKSGHDLVKRPAGSRKYLENILIYIFIYIFKVKKNKTNSSHALCKKRKKKKLKKKKGKI